MPPKRKYEGILREPMEWDVHWATGVKGQIERLAALREHYDLPRDFSETTLMNLVLALAKDHVPGFRMKGPKHKPPWGPKATRDVILLIDMLAQIEAGHSVRNAARLAVKARPHLGLTAESARVRFEEIINATGERGKRRLKDLRALVRALAE